MRILALVDTSLYGKSVVDYAAWAAATSTATVDMLHVVATNEMLASQMPVHPGGAVILAGELPFDDAVKQRAKEGGILLAEARSTLNSRGIWDAYTKIEQGSVVDLVLKSAKHADLVVMGKRGEHADLARLPLGGNVERIVRGADIPVLVVSRAFRPVHRCLLAFDLDGATAGAIEALTIARIMPPMPILVLHAGQDSDELRAAMAAAAERLGDAGFEVTTEIVVGDPSRVIPERAVADSADLVVIGAFGKSRLWSLVFGSLTSEVIRACQTPVLLTKG